MLANTVALVDAARKAGATIMHAPVTFVECHHEISSHPYGILKGVADGNAFVKDSWGATIVDNCSAARTSTTPWATCSQPTRRRSVGLSRLLG